METIRGITSVLKALPVIEGAGVRLKRVFGFSQVPRCDPFLLLDHFGSVNPDDYLAGFPWHPHRGIETVTYMKHGRVEHGDSLGNTGVIKDGDVQWMTAGSGIIHQEMPQYYEGRSMGFQLWVNLPASRKMMAPRYRDITANQIPDVELKPGVKVKVICGQVNGTKGPVDDLVVDVEYYDVSMAPQTMFEWRVKGTHKVIAYVYHGAGIFDPEIDTKAEEENLVLFTRGDKVQIRTGTDAMNFLLVAGNPLNEPVAWQGPIVMNTQEELELAFAEYRQGTFIKS